MVLIFRLRTEGKTERKLYHKINVSLFEKYSIMERKLHDKINLEGMFRNKSKHWEKKVNQLMYIKCQAHF